MNVEEIIRWYRPSPRIKLRIVENISFVFPLSIWSFGDRFSGVIQDLSSTAHALCPDPWDFSTYLVLSGMN